MKNKFNIYYGYWIVLVGFISTGIASGICFYGFSVFNKPIGDDFHWSRSIVTAAFLVYSTTVALFSPFAGRLVDRYGSRRVRLFGTAVLVATLVLLSRISDIWNFYLFYFLLGFAQPLSHVVPVNVNVSNWFFRRRGTMQGIAQTGIGVGGFIFAPLIGNYLIPWFSWRGAFLALAALVLVVMVPLLIFVVKDRPAEKGLQPYGEADTASGPGQKEPPRRGHTLRQTLGTPAFWIVALTSFAYGMSVTGVLQNQVSILSIQGIAPAVAVAAIGVVALFSGASKFLFGFVCDRLDPKYASAIAYILMAISLWIVNQAYSPAFIWVYAVLLGLGSGGWTPNLAMFTVNYFGLKHYGTILGAMYLCFLFGEAVGPLLAGYAYDRTGSYQFILGFFMTICLVSAPLVSLVKKPRPLSK